MRHAFDIDVLACPRCGGRLRLVATIEDPHVIRAILAHSAGAQGFERIQHIMRLGGRWTGTAKDPARR